MKPGPTVHMPRELQRASHEFRTIRTMKSEVSPKQKRGEGRAERSLQHSPPSRARLVVGGNIAFLLLSCESTGVDGEVSGTATQDDAWGQQRRRTKLRGTPSGSRQRFGHRTRVRAHIAVLIFCAASGQDTKRESQVYGNTFPMSTSKRVKA